MTVSADGGKQRVADPRLGKVISGRYRLVERLGTGGMGIVYRAEHILMHKSFAVKVLHAELTRVEAVVERFRREALAASHIDHANVTAATDFGLTEDGEFFLVMEYVEGESLASLLAREKRLPPARVVHIARQMAAALVRTHSAGIIHRDLKPQNVFVITREGDPDFVKIMDFGVARVRFGEVTNPVITQAGMIFGTPRYISPEQALGSSADPRSDLYSLGILLYEMLAGRPPFDAADPTEILGMQVTTEPPPLWMAAEDVDIPSRLAKAVKKLLAKKPDERFQSADELLRELDDVKARLDAGVAEGLPERAWRHATERWRHGGPLYRRIATALLIAGVAAGVTAAAVLAFRPAPPAVAPVVKAEPATPPPVVVPPSPAGLTEELPTSLYDERMLLARSLPELRQATDYLARGDDPAAAAALLEALISSQPESAHLLYLLGVAYARQDRWDDALARYSDALRVDPRYALDGKLQRDVFARLAAPDKKAAAPAMALLQEHPIEPFIGRLAELAMEARQQRMRWRAYGLLLSNGGLAALEPWLRLSVELRAAKRCVDRKKLAKDAHDLGDPRVLPVLESIAMKTRGCGADQMEDCHACMRRTLTGAIRFLQKRAAEGATGPLVVAPDAGATGVMGVTDAGPALAPVDAGATAPPVADVRVAPSGDTGPSAPPPDAGVRTPAVDAGPGAVHADVGPSAPPPDAGPSAARPDIGAPAVPVAPAAPPVPPDPAPTGVDVPAPPPDGIRGADR